MQIRRKLLSIVWLGLAVMALDGYGSRTDLAVTRTPSSPMEIAPLNLTAEEKADLVVFLRSLTGEIAFAVFAPEVSRE